MFAAPAPPVRIALLLGAPPAPPVRISIAAASTFEPAAAPSSSARIPISTAPEDKAYSQSAHSPSSSTTTMTETRMELRLSDSTNSSLTLPAGHTFNEHTGGRWHYLS